MSRDFFNSDGSFAARVFYRGVVGFDKGLLFMKIIMITGKQGSGKSTLASGLLKKLLFTGYSVECLKYASPLYKMHDAVRSILVEYVGPSGDMVGIDGPLLQVLGTEWGRKTRGVDFWVNILKARVASLQCDYLIIDDVRFENELFAFDDTEHSVYKIRLTAPEDVRRARAEKWRENTQHASEVGLDGVDDKEFFIKFSTSGYGADEVLALAYHYVTGYEVRAR